MAEQYHILFGFESSSIQKKITKILEDNGCNVTSSHKTSKIAIQQYIMEHEDCNTVILLENNGYDNYTYSDLVQLMDIRELNIIVVIMPFHKSTEFVQAIYSAGIFNAIFQGDDTGATPSEISCMIRSGRSRKEAREYYGISDSAMPSNYLSDTQILQYVDVLCNDELGNTLGERFFNVLSLLTISQANQLLNKLTEPLKSSVLALPEYHAYFDYVTSKKESSTLPDKLPIEEIAKQMEQGESNNEPMVDNLDIEDENSSEEPKPSLEQLLAEMDEANKEGPKENFEMPLIQLPSPQNTTLDTIPLMKPSPELLNQLTSPRDDLPKEEPTEDSTVNIPLKKKGFSFFPKKEQSTIESKPERHKKEVGFFYKKPKEITDTSDEEEQLVSETKSPSNKNRFLAAIVAVSAFIILIFGFIIIQIVSYQSKVVAAQISNMEAEQLVSNNAIVQGSELLNDTVNDLASNTSESVTVIPPDYSSSSDSVSEPSIIYRTEDDDIMYQSENQSEMGEPQMVSFDNTTTNSITKEEGITVLEESSSRISEPIEQTPNVSTPTSHFNMDNLSTLLGTTQSGIVVINIINANQGSYTIMNINGKSVNVSHGNATPICVNLRASYMVTNASDGKAIFKEL